jgi:hypothetical protein
MVVVVFTGPPKSSRQSNGSLENVVDRDVALDVTLKSETLKSSSKPLQEREHKIVNSSSTFIENPHGNSKMYLSVCDIVPDPQPKLFGDEFDEQKLSIDTESLPVLDFLIVGGLHVGDSSKLMSCTSLLTWGAGGAL